jgi:PAS domain S-box-containing protein
VAAPTQKANTARHREPERLIALDRYKVLDTGPELAFDRIVDIAVRAFQAPIGLLALVDRDRQWFKARRGIDLRETAREIGLCAHTILEDRVLVIPDAARDARYARSPLVTGGPHIRFFAGAPLKTPEGYLIGSLAVADPRPREFSAAEQALLADLASLAMDELELRGRTQAQVRASEENRNERRFRALIENGSDGISVIGADGAVLYRSPSSSRIVGYGPDSTTPGTIFDYVHPEDRELVMRLWGEALEKPDVPIHSEARVRREDGSWRVLEGVLVNRLADPAVCGLVCNFRDITERRRLEERLLIADRMASVGTLAAGVAHEINNPLAYIHANLDLALELIATGKAAGSLAQMTDALRDAKEGAERVRAIVRELKTFSRPGDAPAGPVDVNQVLHSSLLMARNEISHRARLVTHFAQAPSVTATEARLGQVFLNLLVNAAQAISPGNSEVNEIRVSTSTDVAGNAVVLVRDSGCGMTPEIRRRIFDPFFTTKPVGVGTGLGLSICHGIVSALGGQIFVESEPGKGSEFRVVLPPSVRFPEARMSPMAKESGKHRGRILAIDDDPLIRKVLERALETEHDVRVLGDAREALADIDRGATYDVILCDLMMPGMTGMGLHEALARSRPELAERMVFLTGGAFTEAARAFLDRVPNLRMEKPIGLSDLRGLVRSRLTG